MVLFLILELKGKQIGFICVQKLIHFSYDRIKNYLTLSKFMLICNYFYSEVMTTIIIVLGIIVF